MACPNEAIAWILPIVEDRWTPKVVALQITLGRRVRRLREEQGLTQEQVAERSGFEVRHWQKLEAGEVGVTLRTIVRLAEGLDVDPLTLLR